MKSIGAIDFLGKMFERVSWLSQLFRQFWIAHSYLLDEHPSNRLLNPVHDSHWLVGPVLPELVAPLLVMSLVG